jgi:hypothetical protein
MQNSVNPRLALYGAGPRGKNIVSNVSRKDLCIVTSLEEIYRITCNQTGAKSQKGENKRVGSIVIIACPGDDLSLVSDIYSLATELKILVTAIIITDSECRPTSHSESLSVIRRCSDSVVVTSDLTYLQYMLECVLYD